MSKLLSLTTRRPSDPVAWLFSDLPNLGLERGSVPVSTLLAQAVQLAEALPDFDFVINLSENRFLFLLGLCASLVKGQTTLLPPNKRKQSQQQLKNQYSSVYVLHDGRAEVAELPCFDVSRFDVDASVKRDQIPKIDESFIAVISFTSGSTGTPKSNIKSFNTLYRSTLINRQYMLPSQEETYFHLSTVPCQHMWGLETSVLLALFAPVCIADSQPFFPADVIQQLECLPDNKTLVSTPVHLRALLGVNSRGLELSNVLCATAPLSKDMAINIESKFSCRLIEVYGCSEVGSMAFRYSAIHSKWQMFEGLSSSQAHGKTVVSADHLPEAVVLEDRLEFDQNKAFTLIGRDGDIVKVAGKRGSLQEVTTVLLDYQDLVDGVVFIPPTESESERLAALVVFKEGENVKGLKKYLLNNLDSAFVPRPILSVDKLPREENGKLSRQRVIDYYKDLTKSF